MGPVTWTAGCVLFVLCTGFCRQVSCEGLHSEDYIKQKVEHFQIRLHEAFERHRLQRARRDVVYPGLDDSVLQKEHFRIIGTRPADLGVHLANVSHWEPIDFLGAKLLFVASNNGKLELFRWSNGGYVAFTGTETHVATSKAKTFIHGDQLWLVCLHHQFGRLEHFIRLYQLVGKTVVMKQTIALGGEADMSLVGGSLSHYLVTCVFRKHSASGVSYEGNVVLYEWKNTQFDSVSQHSVVGARSVVAWSMDGPLYVAVAQQRDNEGELAMGSPVFIYNQRREHELSYVQVIRLWQASHVNHFTVAAVHYLTFATKQGVLVYWYSGDQFLEWQTLLGTEDAEYVEVFNLPNGEAAIAVVRQEEVMFFSETEMATYNRSTTTRVSGTAITKVAFQYLHGNYYLFATYSPEKMAKYSPMQLVLEKYTSVPFTKKDPLLRCLHDLETLLSRRQKHIDKLAANIGRVWTSDKPRPLATDLLVVNGQVKVLGALSAPQGVLLPGAQRVPQVTPSGLAQQLQEAGNTVSRIEDGLKNVVFKSLPQTIKGNLRFTKPVSSSVLHMNNFHSGTLNGVPLARLSDGTLKTRGNQVLNHPVTFSGLSADNLFSDSVNGVNISDVMMTNKDQVVKGSFKLSHIALSDLVVEKGHAINGIRPDQIVTTNTPQLISGHKTFKKLNVIRNLSVKTTTNGKDLSEFAKTLVPLNGNSHITGHWRFTAPITVIRGLNLKLPINGIFSIPKLVSEAVDIGSTQVISGAKTYKVPVHFHGNVDVSGSFNGIRVSRDLVTLNTEQNIEGTWTFRDAVHFKKNLDTKLVNGIDILKEAVLRNRKNLQIVYGKKTFLQDMGVNGGIGMTRWSTIDGVDPSEFVRGTGAVTVYEGPVTIGNMVVQKDVIAEKGINDKILRDLRNLIWLKSVDQEIKVPVKFNRVHLEGDLDTETVNGVNLDTDLAKTFGDEVWSGPVTFKDSIYVRGPVDFAPGVKINGVDLSEISKLVTQAHRNSVIHGNITFPSLIAEHDIHCEKVNGFRLAQQFMLVNAEQVVSGTQSFKKPISVKHLSADFADPVMLNGVKLRPFLNEVVLRDGPHLQPVSNKNFVGGIHADHVRAAGSIDGVNVDQMLRSVVLLNVPQTIKGPKQFLNPLVLDALLTDHVNGINIKERVAKVIRRDVKGVVTGKKYVKGRVLVHGNINTRGLINGLDIKDVYARALSKTRENLITAPMTFMGGIEAGMLQLYEPAKLDGVSLANVIPLRESSKLLGNVVFRNLLSDGHIKIRGLLNGCNITKLYEEAIYLNGDKQTLGGDTSFSKLFIRGNVHMLGPVNNVSLNNLLGSLVNKYSPQVITGPLTFSDKVSVERLTLKGPINGLNLESVLADAVTKSTIQTIKGAKTFTGPHALEVTQVLNVHNDVHSHGPVGGIKIEDLNTVVTTHGQQEVGGKKTVLGGVHVTGDVHVKGTLNGLHVPQDLVLSDIPERIPGKTILSGPSAIRGNLNVNKVNDLDLNTLLRDRLKLDGDQNLRSKLVFEDDIAVKGNFAAQKLNDIPREAIVTQTGRHTLRGTKTFTKPIEVQGNLKVVTINRINVTNLSKDVVYLNRPQDIPQTTTFSAPIEVVGDMKVTTTVNGVDLRGLKASLEASKQAWMGQANGIVQTVTNQGNVLKKQYEYYLAQATAFVYFELFQTLNIPSTRLLTSPVHRSAEVPWNTLPATTATVWTAWHTRCKNNDDCCREYSTEFLEVKPDGQLAKSSVVLQRRYFPFLFQQGSHQGGFMVWTNTTSHRKSCEYPGNEELVVTTVQGASDPSCDRNTRTEFRAADYPFVSDVRFFEFQGEAYLVVASSFSKFVPSSANGGQVDVFRHVADHHHWVKLQTLNTTAAVSLDVAEVSGTVLLSVASRQKRGPIPMKSSVYKWSKVHQGFTLLSEVATSMPSSTLFVRVGQDVACVFANEKAALQQDRGWVIAHTEPASVYKFTHNTLQLLQNIPMYGVNCMEKFYLAGDSFLVLGSMHLKAVSVYRWRGYSKFEAVQTISVSPVHLHVYRSHTGNTLLTVSTQCGRTKVLRAVIQGRCDVEDPRLRHLVGRA
ncbi:uncharacterized protein LOC135392097 [Ornithodoros turicata]|uniref:uncharacterized protein LOC135392097 n=1 Tax=Ornithodoros turicata TaxID=34597 RepID=UPI003138C898